MRESSRKSKGRRRLCWGLSLLSVVLVAGVLLGLVAHRRAGWGNLLVELALSRCQRRMSPLRTCPNKL